MLSICSQLWGKLNRRKTLQDDIMETPLKRCLNTFDLTLLGIGHMVGAGIFVLTGTVVKDEAGPAAVLSYLFAGVGALLSSLCYAEFGAKVPKAGSAYTYTYVTIGEFWAFIIGWNIILEHLLGVASVARAFSGSFDALFDGAIKNGTLKYIGEMNVPWISNYLDFIAFLSVLVIMVFIASGARISITVNSVFTLINLLVILLIISVGLGCAKGENWSNPSTGGFLPFGFPGVFAGAATCFYAYIGFEGIAVAGEEAKNPAKSIPIATCLAMTIVTLLYMGSSAALTLMIPYTETDVAAPFPHAFAYRGLNWAKYVIAIGALFGIITSLLGGLFSMPRAVYAMASDGLLFKGLALVHPKTQTPIVSIALFGTLSAFLGLFIDIEVLVEFLSIGTLMSFTMVAASVIILRYQPASSCQFKLRPESEAPTPGDQPTDSSDKQSMLKESQSHDDIGRLKSRWRELPVLKNMSPEFTTTAAVCIMAAFMLMFALLLLVGYDHVSAGKWWAVILLILAAAGIAVSFTVLLFYEQNKSFLTFQIPFVPLLPAISMLFNMCMMIKLSPYTWIRLVIWLALGFVIYFIYGMRNSNENRPLSAYSQVLSYGGSDASGPSQGLEEKYHMPQPPDGPARPEPLPEVDETGHS